MRIAVCPKEIDGIRLPPQARFETGIPHASLRRGPKDLSVGGPRIVAGLKKIDAVL
jgi:hypothetical protein